MDSRTKSLNLSLPFYLVQDIVVWFFWVARKFQDCQKKNRISLHGHNFQSTLQDWQFNTHELYLIFREITISIDWSIWINHILLYWLDADKSHALYLLTMINHKILWRVLSQITCLMTRSCDESHTRMTKPWG